MRKNKQVIYIEGLDLAFLTDTDAAKWLGCSRSTIWNYVNSDKLLRHYRLVSIPYELAKFQNMRFYEGYLSDKEMILAVSNDRNDEPHWFYDLAEAAEWFDCTKGYVSRCINENRKCKGYWLKWSKKGQKVAWNV